MNRSTRAYRLFAFALSLSLLLGAGVPSVACAETAAPPTACQMQASSADHRHDHDAPCQVDCCADETPSQNAPAPVLADRPLAQPDLAPALGPALVVPAPSRPDAGVRRASPSLHAPPASPVRLHVLHGAFLN